MNKAKVPAFPVPLNPGEERFRAFKSHGEADGLTKRELFAAMAMQGFAAAAPHSFATMNDAVEAAVMWADLLLAELAKEGES